MDRASVAKISDQCISQFISVHMNILRSIRLTSSSLGLSVSFATQEQRRENAVETLT